MLPKIKAAADARTRDTLIVARTDALAVEGIDAALERAEAFIAAGADLTFVEAPRDAGQMRRIATLGVPQVANIVHGGKTPALPQDELAAMGFGLVLYANAALQAAVRASSEVLAALKATGSLDTVHDRLASFEERQAAVAKHRWDALEQRFKAG
jgi:2-methylisocitrate lyase-like PEP mutase family enzyme